MPAAFDSVKSLSVVVGEEDGIAAPSTVERQLAALRNVGVEVENRKYGGIGHGFGVGIGTSADGFVSDGVRFCEDHPRSAQ